MSTRISCCWLLVSISLLIQITTSVQAIPVFARKYGFNCTMCHSNFPRLNDYGLRYRFNGYQLPGRENEERTVLDSPTPLALRTSVGYTSDQFENTPGAEEVNSFRVEGLDVLAGGLLGRNIGTLLVYVPEINGSTGVAPQSGTLEMANVVFAHIAGDRTSLRVGRFEPAYVAFSVKRRLSVSLYDIYDFTFAENEGWRFSDTQTGLEFAGDSDSGLQYALGWVNGSGTNSSNDSPSDVYLRLAKIFGRGEGQTAGQRLGIIAYRGSARPASGGSREDFTRFGVDASLNWQVWNLGLQYITATDDGALWGTTDDVDYSGGFARLLYMPTTRWVGFTHYDLVNSPDIIDQDIRRWTVGARYYFVDNLALHLEYSHRTQDAPPTCENELEETLATARLDYAF